MRLPGTRARVGWSSPAAGLFLFACGVDTTFAPLPEGLPPTVLFASASGGAEGLIQIDPARSTLAPEGSLSGALLLGYACEELSALGLTRSGEGWRFGVEVRTRAPDQLYRWEGGGDSGRWVEAPIEVDTLSPLAAELSFPSPCRIWEPRAAPAMLSGSGGYPLLVAAPGGSGLVLSGPGNRRLWWVRGPEEVSMAELPSSVSVSAAEVDDRGRLWLYDVAGRLYRAELEDLESIATRLEALPSPPQDLHPCDQVLVADRAAISVQTGSSTAGDVLVTDGNGRLLRFFRGAWTVLADPVGADANSPLRCALRYPNVLWVGPSEAITANRGLGNHAVVRIRLDESGRMTVTDDRAPEVDITSIRIFDLGAHGVIAAAGLRGALVARTSDGWRWLEQEGSVRDVVTFVVSGPDGSILFGNDRDGLRQHWMGHGTCSDGAEHLHSRFMVGIAEGEYLGSSAASTRAPQLWRLRSPTACEPWPR